MRTFGKMVMTLGAAALLASPAFAQGRPGGGFGGGMMGGGPQLLTNTGVQKELKLDSAQVEKATKVAAEMREKRQGQFQSFQNLSDDERRTRMQAIADENRKAVKDILKDDQYKRYEQIVLQQRGLMAFSDPELQKKLNLTDDQKSKLRDMVESYNTEARELGQGFQNDREGTMEKMRTLRKERLDKALAAMTDDQKKTWKELTGDPFEVRFEPRPQ